MVGMYLGMLSSPTDCIEVFTSPKQSNECVSGFLTPKYCSALWFWTCKSKYCTFFSVWAIQEGVKTSTYYAEIQRGQEKES